MDHTILKLGQSRKLACVNCARDSVFPRIELQQRSLNGFFCWQIFLCARKALPAGMFLCVFRHQKGVHTVHLCTLMSREKYGGIKHNTSRIFKTTIYIYFTKVILYQQPAYTVKSHNTNTTTIEKVCASNQCIFPSPHHKGRSRTIKRQCFC